VSATYSVTTQGYCGMSIPHGSDYTYEEARARVKQRIEWFKARIGGAVVKLGRNQWELQEPENCMMVPDACGTLEITKGESRIQ
jgi:hypothetical protein